MTKNAEESKYFSPLACAVASGRKVSECASEIGCSESYAYQLCRTDEFRLKVHELRSEAVNIAVGRLSDLADAAVQVYAEIMQDGEAKPECRLKAAELILKSILPLSEHAELRQRIDDLERRAMAESGEVAISAT